MSLSNKCSFCKTTSENQDKKWEGKLEEQFDVVHYRTASDCKTDVVFHEPDVVHGTASENRLLIPSPKKSRVHVSSFFPSLKTHCIYSLSSTPLPQLHATPHHTGNHLSLAHYYRQPAEACAPPPPHTTCAPEASTTNRARHHCCPSIASPLRPS